MSNDLSPEEYQAIESAPQGWHRVGDLPRGMEFRSHETHSGRWYVVAEPERDDRVTVQMLATTRRTTCSSAMTVWVD